MRRLLLDLDSYGGTVPLGMFPLFLKGQLMFWPFVSVLSFSSCFVVVANVTRIPLGPPSFSEVNYRSISFLTKVFERLASFRLGQFVECRSMLPTIQLANRKSLGICAALQCVAHISQNALETGQKARIIQIDLSDAFVGVNHQGILPKLCFV